MTDIGVVDGGERTSLPTPFSVTLPLWENLVSDHVVTDVPSGVSSYRSDSGTVLFDQHLHNVSRLPGSSSLNVTWPIGREPIVTYSIILPEVVDFSNVLSTFLPKVGLSFFVPCVFGGPLLSVPFRGFLSTIRSLLQKSTRSPLPSHVTAVFLV